METTERAETRTKLGLAAARCMLHVLSRFYLRILPQPSVVELVPTLACVRLVGADNLDKRHVQPDLHLPTRVERSRPNTLQIFPRCARSVYSDIHHNHVSLSLLPFPIQTSFLSSFFLFRPKCGLANLNTITTTATLQPTIASTRQRRVKATAQLVSERL